MRDFRSLRVWQSGHRFVLAVYGATAAFPSAERFGLTSQLRRAAASITATIAEGAAASTDSEQRRFFVLAFRSSCECLNHLLLARDLGYLEATAFEALETELGALRRMLYRLIQRAKA